MAVFKVTGVQGMRAIIPLLFHFSAPLTQRKTVHCGLYAGTKEEEDRKHAKTVAFTPLHWNGDCLSQLRQVFICTDISTTKFWRHPKQDLDRK